MASFPRSDVGENGGTLSEFRQNHNFSSQNPMADDGRTKEGGLALTYADVRCSHPSLSIFVLEKGEVTHEILEMERENKYY